MSSTSDSSATEYRRRLPEIPRAVKFSGDVLHRIDDVAEKIDHVGNRMKQVENLMADYQGQGVKIGSNTGPNLDENLDRDTAKIHSSVWIEKLIDF